MPAALSARLATPQDANAVHRLIQEKARFEKLESRLGVTAPDLALNILQNNDHGFVILSENEQGPAGFAFCYKRFSTFLGRFVMILDDLFVTETARGQGAASVILQFVADLTAREQCARLDWMVLDWNKKAIEFYRHMGAQEGPGFREFSIPGNSLTSFGHTQRP